MFLMCKYYLLIHLAINVNSYCLLTFEEQSWTDWNRPIECKNMSYEKMATDIAILKKHIFAKKSDMSSLNYSNLRIADINIPVLNDETVNNLVSNSSSLLMRNCNISKIDSFIEKTSTLNEIELLENSIEIIDGGVIKVPELYNLNLTNNKIKKINDLCRGSKQIRTIILHNNRLKIVEENYFQSCTLLGHLDLSNCQIENIATSAFETLKKLATLNLNNNLLKKLEINFFENSVQTILVSDNELLVLDLDNLKRNSHLRELNASNNQISNIVAEDLSPHNIYTMILHNNNLSRISSTAFKYCTHLDLSRNSIESITPSSFDFTRSANLILSDSLHKIENISNTFFNACNIRVLDFSNSGIKNIEPYAFKFCQNLFELNLKNNYLNVLKKDVFIGLENIQKLDLENNTITEVESGVFIGLETLRNGKLNSIFTNTLKLSTKQFVGLIYTDTIDLSNTTIQYIEKCTFQKEDKLSKIYLNNTCIHNMQENVFCSNLIRIIHMSNSCIQAISSDTFSETTNLEQLILSQNNISNLPEDVFKNLESLIILDLSSNSIEKISSSVFFSLRSLKELYISKNLIRTIESFAFYNLKNLVELDLKNNPISNIEPHAFTELPQAVQINYFKTFQLKEIKSMAFFGLIYLSELDLSNTNLEHIDSHAFTLQNNFATNYKLDRLKINLQNNNIKDIPKYAFRYLKIREINLSYNNISNIDGDAFSDLKVRNLSLSYNTLTKLSNSVFKHFSCEQSESVSNLNLKWLYLKNSGIFEIENHVFDNLCRLIILNIEENYITVLKSKVFSKLENLKELFLAGNPIHKIELNAFYGLSKLHTLNLSNLNLHVLNSTTFSGLSSVTKMSLTNSIITIISPGAFGPLYDLQNLYLNFNRIDDLQPDSFLYSSRLQTLDLSCCEFKNSTIRQGAFNGLERLKILHLENCSLSFTNYDDNKIEHSFVGLNYLEKLYLDHNNISHVTCDMFTGLDNLLNLHLSHNKMASIDICGFQYFSNLKKLHLEFNKLSSILVGTYAALDSIKYLNLSHNMLRDFNPFVYYNMPKLEFLDISFNSLYTRSFLHIFKFNSTVTHMQNLKYVGLTRNKFPCNNLMDFLKYLKNRNIAYKPDRSILEYNTTNIDGIACSLFQQS